MQCVAFCGDRNNADWTQCESDVCYIFGFGLVKYVARKSIRGTEWDWKVLRFVFTFFVVYDKNNSEY